MQSVSLFIEIKGFHHDLFSNHLRIRRSRRAAVSPQPAHKCALRQGTQFRFLIRISVQKPAAVICAALYCQDRLACSRNHFICRKVTADPVLQSQPLQAGRSQNCGTVFSAVQLAQPRLHIAADGLKNRLGIQLLKLQHTPFAGTPHRL